jgi:hypothetical protein
MSLTPVAISAQILLFVTLSLVDSEHRFCCIASPFFMMSSASGSGTAPDTLSGPFQGFLAPNVASSFQGPIHPTPRSPPAEGRVAVIPAAVPLALAPASETPLVEFADSMHVDETLVMAVLEFTGAPADTTMEDFAFIDTAEFQEILTDVRSLEGLPLSIHEKSKLRKMWKGCQDHVAGKLVVAQQALVTPQAIPKGTAAAEPSGTKRSFTDTLEQGALGTYEIIDDMAVIALRKWHVKITGRPPPRSTAGLPQSSWRL